LSPKVESIARFQSFPIKSFPCVSPSKTIELEKSTSFVKRESFKGDDVESRRGRRSEKSISLV